MAAGLRAVFESADLIDLVIEVRDARMPRSTAVAALHPKLRGKPTIVLLNRQDLADALLTARWLAALAASGTGAFAGTGTRAATLKDLRTALLAVRGRRGKVRAAVVGAPNTGKSSVINALVRRRRAVAENRAGVTRHIRWIGLDEKTDLLDTPGVLEPRIASAAIAWQLGACGVLPESAFDAESIAAHLVRWAASHHGECAKIPSLESFARRRGMLRRGGEPDWPNAARAYLAAFQAGSFGRITFELPGVGT